MTLRNYSAMTRSKNAVQNSHRFIVKINTAKFEMLDKNEILGVFSKVNFS